MNYLRYIGIYIFFLMICLFCFCEKKINETSSPVAIAKIIPPYGNTVDEFVFDASESIYEGNEDDLFYKWDFDGDGTWDTPYSKNKTSSHRYYSEGNYKPVLIVSNHLSLSDTTYSELNVKAGYSPPKAKFNIYPDHGNLLCNFTFDATKTYDDEDSINNLKFRWDWENDGVWDTDYLTDPVINHTYLKNNLLFSYYITVIVKMEVTDDSGLKKYAYERLNLDRIDQNLNVDFTISPDSGTTINNFTFTAIDCYDPEDDDNYFLYKWRLKPVEGAVLFFTDFSENSFIEFGSFEINGEYKMNLEIKDKSGMVNNIDKLFTVHYQNTPPSADFKIIPARGNVNTNYFFRSLYHSTDIEDFAHELKARWDFDNDGIWDTDFSKDYNEFFHKYPSAGTYFSRVEVMDKEGLTGISVVKQVIVSEGTNETGYVEHKNPRQLPSKWNYYGTVKIGEQWWTSQNISCKKISERINSSFYRNLPINLEIYGGLFSIEEINNQEKDDLYNYPICPKGWRTPTKADWEELFKFLGPSNAAKELKPGGSTDFYVLYGGEQFEESYYGLGKYGCFIYEKEIQYSSNARFYIFNKDSDIIKNPIYSARYEKGSLRCIKER